MGWAAPSGDNYISGFPLFPWHTALCVTPAKLHLDPHFLLCLPVQWQLPVGRDNTILIAVSYLVQHRVKKPPYTHVSNE